MKLMKYSLEQLVEAVKRSDSIRECLILLNVEPFGGNYHTFKKAVKHFNIDTNHFSGKLASSKKNIGKKRIIPIEQLLVNPSNYSSYKLKNRLISEKIFKHECSNCRNVNWLNSNIPLELDHIDGNNSNNIITNLRLLCPNCHALTPTYRGKNIKSKSIPV